MKNKEYAVDQSAGLSVKNISVAIDGARVLHSVSLECAKGTVCVLMGPNGSGKSSLGFTLMGYPRYVIEQGVITYEGIDLVTMSIQERALRGIFLAMQYPVEIAGLSIYALLKEAVRARDGAGFCLLKFSKELDDIADALQIRRDWLHRPLDEGFSGGEKKRIELLQLLMLKPTLAILDEIDAGLDVDMLHMVSDAISQYRKHNPHSIFFVISHQKKFLDLLVPDCVYIMHQSKLVASGDYSLVEHIDLGGYNAVKP